MRIQKILFAGLLALGTASVAHAETSMDRVRPTMTLQHEDATYASAADEREPASHDAYDKNDESYQPTENRKAYHTRDWN